MAFIDFTNGEVLTADQMDTVMRQSVMKFADAAARDTALSAVLAEGMICYLDDTNEVLKYDGSQWIDISGDISGVTAGTALTGGGTSGNVTLDVDETALTIAQSQVTDLTTDLAGKQDDVITTEGDLVIGDASGDPVRLPVGTADQVLTSDGTTVSFQDAGGGGAALLSTTSLAFSNSVEVSNIDQSYSKLIIQADDLQTDGADFLIIRFKNSTTNLLASATGLSKNNIRYRDNVTDLDTTFGIDATDSGSRERIFYVEIENYTSLQAKPFQAFGQGFSGGNAFPINFGGAVIEDVSIDGIEIFLFSGNIFQKGEIKIYGVN